LINEDQTGFMANRYIGDNIRLIYDLISYLYRENKPGLLLCLDFEKAFDSVDWKFMFKVLRAFGFGPDICQWISTFYKDISHLSRLMDGYHNGSLFRGDVDKGIRYHRICLFYV